MNSTFTVLLSGATRDSWPDIVWRDARKEGARICLDFCKPLPNWLRKMRKVHFSNRTNKNVWLPMKTLWDCTNVLRLEDLDPQKRNYIIFQTGVKFSARYIKKLKEERNACIVLYMPDNVRTIGIANDKRVFERFCQHYHIDQAYSFDKRDCEEFGMTFFDIYSEIEAEASQQKQSEQRQLVYVGNCRSKARLRMVHQIFEQLHEECHCVFYLNGVEKKDMLYEDIRYNCPLTYKQVVELTKQSDIILEIMNRDQTGNTLRSKEAVCYDKLLLTNNPAIVQSAYYDRHQMQYFERAEDIRLEELGRRAEYGYKGEYSPKRLLEMIVEQDRGRQLSLSKGISR